MRMLWLVNRSLCAATAIALPGCSDAGTQPVPPDPFGVYSVAYTTPGPLIYVLPNCDRYLQYAITSVGQGTFTLSMNVFEDCRRTGNGFSSWEVYVVGHYTAADTTLTFTPVSPGTAAYSGTFDKSSMRITVPARPDSLATTALHVELVKRTQ